MDCEPWFGCVRVPACHRFDAKHLIIDVPMVEVVAEIRMR